MLHRKIFTADGLKLQSTRAEFWSVTAGGAQSPFWSKMKCTWTVRNKFKQICFYINAHKNQITLQMFWEEIVRKMRAAQSDTPRNSCRVCAGNEPEYKHALCYMSQILLYA